MPNFGNNNTMGQMPSVITNPGFSQLGNISINESGKNQIDTNNMDINQKPPLPMVGGKKKSNNFFFQKI